MGDVLSHTSEPPSSPLSLPASRFNATAVPEPVPVPAHPSTLQRLLNAPLPADTNLIIRHRYTMATEQLLVVLTRGSVSDGETRFAYLLNEKENWESDMTEGLADLHEGIAHILRVLLGLFLSLYMVSTTAPRLVDFGNHSDETCLSPGRFSPRCVFAGQQPKPRSPRFRRLLALR